MKDTFFKKRTHNPAFRPCPFCQKMVDPENEKHTLVDCRNFLLKQFYQVEDSGKRKELEKKIEKVNARMGTKSKNLIDS